MNVAEARRLVGRRVVVTTQDGDLFSNLTGVLGGVPNETSVWIDNLRRDHVVAVTDAPLTGTCGHEAQRLFGELCVNCSRREAAAANQSGANQAKCDDCGKAGAFRNPRDPSDAYRCSACHQVAGTLPGVKVRERAGVIACAGANTDDPRHDWVHVRRSRWQCRCGAKRFVKPVGWQDEKWW